MMMAREDMPFFIHFSIHFLFRVSENFSPENFEKSKKNNTRART
jgi:hypothetical protein